MDIHKFPWGWADEGTLPITDKGRLSHCGSGCKWKSFVLAYLQSQFGENLNVQSSKLDSSSEGNSSFSVLPMCSPCASEGLFPEQQQQVANLKFDHTCVLEILDLPLANCN